MIVLCVSFVLCAANGFALPADPAGKASDCAGESYDCGPYGGDELEEADESAADAEHRAEAPRSPEAIESYSKLARRYNRRLKENATEVGPDLSPLCRRMTRASGE